MKRYLPFVIIGAVLLVAICFTVFFAHRPKPQPTISYASGRPGAEPAHVLGSTTARVSLEEFGDFECMPCFLLWPALKNLEKDFGADLAVTFREHPLPQHPHAMDGARAAEAAGLQGRFWEMHDLLYLNRAKWLRSSDVHESLKSFASQLGLDVAKFDRDLAGAEVAARLQADAGRGESLKIDRTPALFVNGLRVEFEADVEQGIRADIDSALGKPKRR